jgi:hypothetical protein
MSRRTALYLGGSTPAASPSATLGTFHSCPQARHLATWLKLSYASAGGRFGFVGGLGNLDTAGLAATAHLYLSFDDDHATQLLRGGTRLCGGVCDDAGEHRHPVAFEHVTGLILVKIHVP